MKRKKLIVGLGNPGPTYAKTRHNAGRMLVDELVLSQHWSPMTASKKFHSLTTSGTVGNVDVIAALPETFMNDSGLAVSTLVSFYHLQPETDVLLIYDDLDLAFGQYKISPKGPRTHNGVHDVLKRLGTHQLTHVRLGVDDRDGKRDIPPLKYVLMPLTPQQLDYWQTDLFPQVREDILTWLSKN